MPQCTEHTRPLIEKNIPRGHPPDHFLCPISSDCMYDPVVVKHNGFEYRFERTSLDAHAQTRYCDNNPLTNVGGFSEAAAAARTDTELQKEIRQSRWAPEKPEPIVIGGENQEDEPYSVFAALEFRLPSAWSWTGSVWPRYDAERSDTVEDQIVGFILLL